MEHNKQKGFTLVELSIVLVIIGLIVGGVLVGQDLIAAAKVRALVSQVEKFDAGGAAFQAKYAGRAGDILAARASAFGLVGGGTVAVPLNVGDGDGVIEGTPTGGGAQSNNWATTVEMPDVWNHLTESALIPGVAVDASPATKVGKGFWVAGSAGVPVGALTPQAPGSKMYYFLTPAAPAAAGIPAIAGIVTPAEAYGFDNKLDDGLPTSGQTRSADGGTLDASTVSAPGAAVCNTGAAPIQYNLSTENNICSLVVTAQN